MRAWGPEVGPRYIERVQLLQEVPSVETLFRFRAVGFHPLRADRRGQFALRLTGRMRLIIERGPDDRSLTVVEVVDYHD